MAISGQISANPRPFEFDLQITGYITHLPGFTVLPVSISEAIVIFVPLNINYEFIPPGRKCI
jgi:hypothetical protein